MTAMHATEFAATRHLMGLSRKELTQMLPPSNRTGKPLSEHTIKDLESGRLQGSEWMIDAYATLLAEHTREVERLAEGAADGMIITLPDNPKPAGWYVALGARVLDREPDAMLEWVSRD